MSELEVLSNGTPSETEGSPSTGGPVCEKCDSPLPNEAMTACPSCGWYASLGIHVEVAPEWEQACAGQSTGKQQSHLEVWGSLIPVWGWGLLGTTLAMAGASFGLRLWVAENESLHMLCGVLQLFAGISLLAACHLLAFFMAASSDPDMGVMDLVVNPMRGWFKLFAKLPKHFWVLNTANIGLSATLFAMLIVGGIPYEEVWNWGFKPPAKKNLLGAIAQKAGGVAEEDMSMEDSVSAFAQNAGVGGDLPGMGGKKASSGPVERQKIDAVILGYEMATDGRIDRFLLATEYNGKLFYAGRVRPLLNEDEAAELPAKLMKARAPRPIINVPGSAIWLKPRFTCRVTYNRRVESGMLQGIIWEELLGEVNLP